MKSLQEYLNESVVNEAADKFDVDKFCAFVREKKHNFGLVTQGWYDEPWKFAPSFTQSAFEMYKSNFWRERMEKKNSKDKLEDWEKFLEWCDENFHWWNEDGDLDYNHHNDHPYIKYLKQWLETDREGKKIMRKYKDEEGIYDEFIPKPGK